MSMRSDFFVNNPAVVGDIIQVFVDWLTDRLTWMIDWSIDWTTYLLTYLLTYWRCRKGGGGGKIDTKIFVFGESEQADDLTHFLGQVRAIARASQAAVLSMAEVWNAIVAVNVTVIDVGGVWVHAMQDMTLWRLQPKVAQIRVDRLYAVFFCIECTEFVFGRGSALDPTGGAYSAPQTL